ncbi:DUF1707 SHOCT-like domain-containing protein [Williamsia phyllosphaerae]|uniref:DUF1707 domain-containing protein n=1 Tax=Williamsia phyllosphaerae TaxID=885042 RepID=A0ABQ1V173_9NOCA|nr:DUF1707 domain-containing protein [Williamsia phyllosphaerae]GGF34324.1 hypothetical protein GCM10007298_32650 [Williamsia phyllosphaerae]
MTDSLSPTPDNGRARLRASDADRSLVHDILAAAMTQGHLSPTEYETRASSAVAASTFGELDALTDDLPVSDIARAGGPSPDVIDLDAAAYSMTSGASTSPVTTKIAVMSGTDLVGNVPVGSELQVFALMGGAEIDLRRVEFTEPTLTVRAFAIMGGIEVLVPEDATVEISGLGLMGGFSHKAAGRGRPGAPTIKVVGLALMGGVEVERKRISFTKK